jgi:hypothetical protein
VTGMEDSVSYGLYQCPSCHGPGDGPGECRTCLARTRDCPHSGEPVTAEQVQAYMARTYGSGGPIEITEQAFPLRPPSPFTQVLLADTTAMEAAMRVLARRMPGDMPARDESQLE